MITKDNIIQGDKFKFIADDYLDEDKKFISLKNKPKIIFCKTDYIPIFENKVLPYIDYKFKIITHNSDIAIDDRHLNFLNNDNLIKWYGMNCHITHNKLQPIPIGIANEKWPHGNKEILIKVANKNIKKKNRVYCNFDPNTNKERYQILEKIKSYNFIDFEKNNLDYETYLTKLASYEYVISPPGNSVDCHRIWESIYLKTVPIVQNHHALDEFTDLPVKFITDWGNIKLEKITNSSKNNIFNFKVIEKEILTGK
jgi:hypothetical protein